MKQTESRNRLGKAEMATIVATYLLSSDPHGQRILTLNSHHSPEDVKSLEDGAKSLDEESSEDRIRMIDSLRTMS